MLSIIGSQPIIAPAAAAGILLTTETLNALGFSAPVALAGKTTVGVQFFWTGASTAQGVRISGSYDGGTTWHSLSGSLTAEFFLQAEISDYAAAGLQPGMRYRMTVPELTHMRLRWVSGTATSLMIIWGVGA